jgi:hypothetical protein
MKAETPHSFCASRTLVSGRGSEQRTCGQLSSGVQGRSPWGESPQAFDYKRKLVTLRFAGVAVKAETPSLWLRLRRAVLRDRLAGWWLHWQQCTVIAQAFTRATGGGDGIAEVMEGVEIREAVVLAA